MARALAKNLRSLDHVELVCALENHCCTCWREPLGWDAADGLGLASMVRTFRLRRWTLEADVR